MIGFHTLYNLEHKIPWYYLRDMEKQTFLETNEAMRSQDTRGTKAWSPQLVATMWINHQILIHCNLQPPFLCLDVSYRIYVDSNSISSSFIPSPTRIMHYRINNRANNNEHIMGWKQWGNRLVSQFSLKIKVSCAFTVVK